MKSSLLVLIGLAMVGFGLSSYGHGQSEQMKALLNAKTPEWMTIGSPIKVDSVDESVANETTFRHLPGESRNTRDRVVIPSRGIEIKVDYPISWFRGCSLSPDGTKLIINSGHESHLLEIRADGSYHAIDLRLPKVTYDAGPKGFITGWSWADDKTLIGESEIDTEKGEFIERRIYVFHLEASSLRRLDVSGLNLPSLEGLTVAKVGNDLNHLMISVGGKDFTVKADLRPPPSVKKPQEGTAPSKPPPIVPASTPFSSVAPPAMQWSGAGVDRGQQLS